LRESFNSSKFKDFIAGLLDQMQPYPAPNSVIVMDNCRIHKVPVIQEMIKARYACQIFVLHFLTELFRGMKLEYLPAYSPDFNPIEQAFSAIKAYVRRHYRHFARSHTTGTNPMDEADTYEMLHNAVFSITPDDAAGFYHHSGYL
jgi:transposase